VRVFYAPYELKPHPSVKSLSGRAQGSVRLGALLKIDHPGLGIGYADLHPWPELGDLPLHTQLTQLKEGILTPLSRNSVEFTRIDAQARSSETHLWEGLAVPPSHALINEIGELFDERRLSEIFSQGFDRIKIKLGRDPENEAILLNALARRLQGRALLRLDFNSILSPEIWRAFVASLTDSALQSIEFVEDPVVWSAQSGFGPSPERPSLAVDRDSDSVTESAICPPYFIIKPAVSDVGAILQRARAWQKHIVFTSYLDHPLGQLWAAWAAATAARSMSVETCGLLSQGAYEDSVFSSLIVAQGPKLDPRNTIGICDSELLEKHAAWKELE
jgi:O-succinylbenzoate synthase